MIRLFVDCTRRTTGFPGLHAAPSRAVRTGASHRNTQVYSRQWSVAARNAALPWRTGAATFSGAVKIKGAPDVPVSRPVVVFDLSSRLPLAETLSALDGSYHFGGLPATPVFVVSFDTAGVHRAVISDNLIPEATP